VPPLWLEWTSNLFRLLPGTLERGQALLGTFNSSKMGNAAAFGAANGELGFRFLRSVAIMNMEHADPTDNSRSSALAFDYGTKRIGVAAGNSHLGTAEGIGLVDVRNGVVDENKIYALINEWQPQYLVVGLPVVADKSNLLGLRKVRNFGNWLKQRFDLPVHFVNEALTTEEAVSRMKETGIRHSPEQKTKLRNLVAAQIILETYFSS